MPKDYWSMNDTELEQEAWKYRIPPYSRAGEQLQHWFVDRERIIPQLVMREQALAGIHLPQARHAVSAKDKVGIAAGIGSLLALSWKAILYIRSHLF